MFSRMSTSDPTSTDTSTTFGFRNVREDERQGLINDVFSKVAERYDLMNDLMSGGLHRLWKSDFVSMLNPPKGEAAFRLLDVAGGTGDIAMRALGSGGPNTSAVICDISPEMLDVGRQRVANAGLSDRITLIEGNAETLPFDPKTCDAYTISFGIRNVTHIDNALSEAFRVLKTGGHFLCLEFSEVQVPILQVLAPEAKIVPIAVPPTEQAVAIGLAVGQTLAGQAAGRVCVVGSPDLTHHGGHFGHSGGHGETSEAVARANDRRMLDLIEALAADAIVPEATRRHNACGAGAIAASIAATQAMGASAGRVLDYTNSYEIVQ